jgi:adenylosuccinate lyase
MLTELNAISPIDGRYRSKTKALANYFSEEALIKYRVLVEVEYFIALCEYRIPQLKEFPASVFPELRKLYREFSMENALWIKEKEKNNKPRCESSRIFY